MRLILVRHVETEGNIKRIMNGQSPGRLSRNGRMQVSGLGRKLRNERIDVIYSSDLRRSVHTTRAISKFHDVPVRYLKVLREINPGVYEGMSYDLFLSHMRARKIRSSFRPKGGESYNDVKRRLRKFTAMLGSRCRDKTVLVSTHGMVLKCLLSIYLKIPLEDVMGLHIRNAGYLILDVKGPKAKTVKDELIIGKK